MCVEYLKNSGELSTSGLSVGQKHGDAPQDAQRSGMLRVFALIADSWLTAKCIDVSKCKLAPKVVKELAALVPQMTHIAQLTIDSTSDIKKQSTYTLDTNDSALDLSSKNLGEEDIALVSAWIQLPQSKGLRVLNVLKNPIGEAGLSTLVDAVRGLPIGSICGLTEGQTSVDWSGQGLGPMDCKIIAADFGLACSCLQQVSVLNLSNNATLLYCTTL
jgi:hypothetical protein